MRSGNVMFKTVMSVLFGMAVLLTTPVMAEVAPDVQARATTNEVIRIVRQDPELRSGQSKKIYELVDAKILPHFDFTAMAKLAVARNWNKATPAQQDQLVEEFRTMLVRTYAAAIAGVSEYRIDFKPLRMSASDTDVTVNSEVVKPGAPPITIDYRMEKQRDGWKVYDVLVEGASLVTVYRNSFNSEVRRNGIDGLIQTLARRNQRTATN